MKKSEESLPDACNTMKRNSIYIMGITEGKKEKGTKSICKTIMPENFPTWKKVNIQIHEQNINKEA